MALRAPAPLSGGHASGNGGAGGGLTAAHVKRFLELCNGDRAFRACVRSGMPLRLEAWGVPADASALRRAWEASADDVGPAVAAYREMQERSRTAGLRAASRLVHADSRYAAWRARQLARTRTQTNPPNWVLAHFPYAIELARGCSVGCEYCCFAAPPVSAVARYTPENARLFESMLRVFAGFFGPAADTGFLYWATDPLDNPDYERYRDAFRDVLGVHPRTTTATWHRDIERTRRLIASSAPDEGRGDVRLSVNTLRQLHLCLRSFTPEELADVPLVLQNPESTSVRVATGRAAGDPHASVDTNTNVSGVIVSLVDYTARLITPSTDLDRWPLGHAVLRDAPFRDAAELESLLETWADEVMAETIDDRTVPVLRPDLRRADDDRTHAVTLRTGYAQLVFDDPIVTDVLRALDGRRAVAELAAALDDRHGHGEVRDIVRRLHAEGLLMTR